MHASRRDQLRGPISEVADGLLVVDRSDLRYLTGFTGSNGALFLSSFGTDGDIFSTDGRYTEQAARQCPDLGILVSRNCLEAVTDQAISQGSARLAVDGRLTTGQLGKIESQGLVTVIIDGLVAAARMVKDSDEIAAIEEACAITSGAVIALASQIRVGDTEIGIARRLEQLFGEFGAQDRAFATIVATGANSAHPHHEPTAQPVRAGDLLVIDSGARVRGYHSDMTRTFMVGEPSAWQLEIYDVVAAAAKAGRSAVRPGIALADLDAAARQVIEHAGFGQQFGHGLGHGIGLEIHEAPMIGPRSEGRLAAETMITVEPGVYLPGRGGVRIEDSLLVTADGHRSLTSAPRDLRVVG